MLSFVPRIVRASSSLVLRVNNTSAASQKIRLVQRCRFYATPGRPKTAVGESSPVKRTRSKTTAKKAPAGTAKKAKKTNKTKSKPVKPVKKVKKVLTEAQKEKKQARVQADKVKALKVTALKPPRVVQQVSAWNMYVAEKSTSGIGVEQMAGLRSGFENLSAAEVEHYNHLARTRTESRVKELKDWIESHSPKVIADANVARRALRKLEEGKTVKRRWPAIEDHRLPTRPITSYLRFYHERTLTGDFNHISIPDRAKLASQEWKDLSASEKSKYETESAEASRKYQAEMDRLLG